MMKSIELLICICMVTLLMSKTEGLAVEGEACGIAGLELGTCASAVSCLDAKLNCADGLRCCRGNAVAIKAKNEKDGKKGKGRGKNKKGDKKGLYSAKIPVAAAADYSIFEDES